MSLVSKLAYSAALAVIVLGLAIPPAMAVPTITKNSFKVNGTIKAGTMTFTIGRLQGTVTTKATDTAATKAVLLAAEINRIDGGAAAYVDPNDNTKVRWNNAGNPTLFVKTNTTGDPWAWTTDLDDNPLPLLLGSFALPTNGIASGSSHTAFGFSSQAGDGNIDLGLSIPLTGGESGSSLIATMADYFDDFAPIELSTYVAETVEYSELTVDVSNLGYYTVIWDSQDEGLRTTGGWGGSQVAVPEPGTIALLVLGGLAVLWRRAK